MYNYYSSAETEIVALQPKAPFMGTELNFSTNLNQWQDANIKNYPFMVYKPDPANGSVMPQRIAPALKSDGILEGLKRAEEDMYRVTGIYPSGLGKQANETSGKAIAYRQREGDTGTFVYIDNFARAIKHTGRILIDMIPHVYDTKRTVRILGEDGQVDEAKLNQPHTQFMMNGLQGLTPVQQIENDVTVGQYDVMTQVGPSYTTRREEAKEGMINLMQTSPGFAPLIMDLVAKAQDWPMADTIAERAHLLLPPMIQMAEMARKNGATDEEIQKAVLDEMQQQQQKPDPKAQAEAESIQQKTQQEGEKHQADMQIKGMQAQHDQSMAQMEAWTQQILNAIKVQQQEIQVALAAAKLQESKKKHTGDPEKYA